MAGGNPIPTSEQRVIDPVLTNVARGWSSPQPLVSDALFPRVPVAARAGKLVVFDRTSWRKFDTKRAPGAGVKRVQFGHEGEDYALADHDIEGQVPIEHMQDAQAVPGIDAGSRAVAGAMQIIDIEREIEAAVLATTAANYDAANREALAGDDQWSHEDSDPLTQVADAIATVRSRIGMRPNTIVLGGKVYDRLSVHPVILDTIKHTATARVAGTEDLARLFRVAKVHVGDAVQFKDDDTTEDIWGSNVVVAYTMVGSMDAAMPSYGYCYELMEGTTVEMSYWDATCKSWVYPASACYKNSIVGKDAGYLFTNVLAA